MRILALAFVFLCFLKGFSEEKKLDYYLRADLLYWQNLQIESDIGIIEDNNASYLEGRWLKFATDYHFAYRAFLGKKFEKWNLEINYLRFFAEDTKHFSVSSDQDFFAFLGSSSASFSGPESDGCARMRNNFNNINLELSRYYFSDDKIEFFPVFGLGTVFLKQDYDLILKTLNYKFYSVNKLSSFGPRLGFILNKKLLDNFKFSLRGFCSAFFVWNKVSASTQMRSFGSQMKIKDSQSLLLSFGYESFFARKRAYLDLDLGYEIQRYANFSYLSYKKRDFYLHGLTAGLKVIF